MLKNHYKGIMSQNDNSIYGDIIQIKERKWISGWINYILLNNFIKYKTYI